MVLRKPLNCIWRIVGGGKISLAVNTKSIMRKCTRKDKNFHIALEKNLKKCYNQKDFYISQCRSLLFLYKS